MIPFWTDKLNYFGDLIKLKYFEQKTIMMCPIKRVTFGEIEKKTNLF